MKKNNLFLFVIALFIATSIISCKGGNAEKDSKADSVATTANQPSSTSTSVKKYSMKSGKVTANSEMMGMKQVMITYFDDFGSKECIETTGDFMGQKLQNRTIMTADFVYQLDMLKKTGFKTKKTGAMQGANIDFSNVSEDMLKSMKMKKEGTENFLGKTCDKYSINSDMMKGYFLVWNNIALKTEGEAMKIKMKIEASQIEENASIPSEIFEIPVDMKITER